MRLNDSVVVISGMGLMGASLALALRGNCKKLVGVARRPEVARRAVRTGAVDVGSCDLRLAAKEADIVVLATPVCHILASIPEAAACMRPGALLMDLGSTKVEVVAALGRVPDGLVAVGGHPMCGKEIGGLEGADPSIFRGATFVLTPTARTTDAAMLLAHELVEATGALPLVLDAERHDRGAALISHLPYLLAASLAQAEKSASASDPTPHMLAASGFRDTTRLAASQVEMMLDTLLTNKEPVEEALRIFERTLAEVKSLLDNPVGLREWMEGARQWRKGMFV